LTPLANLHITIDFLGNVEQDAEESLRFMLGRLRMAPFEVRPRAEKAWPLWNWTLTIRWTEWTVGRFSLIREIPNDGVVRFLRERVEA